MEEQLVPDYKWIRNQETKERRRRFKGWGEDLKENKKERKERKQKEFEEEREKEEEEQEKEEEEWYEKGRIRAKEREISTISLKAHYEKSDKNSNEDRRWSQFLKESYIDSPERKRELQNEELDRTIKRIEERKENERLGKEDKEQEEKEKSEALKDTARRNQEREKRLEFRKKEMEEQQKKKRLEDAWKKKYLTFKKGQEILLHDRLSEDFEFQFVKILSVSDGRFTVKLNSWGRVYEEDILIDMEFNTFSTDVFTKHITNRDNFDNLRFTDLMINYTPEDRTYYLNGLIIQTFQTARKKSIFQKKRCYYKKKCNDLRVGHMMFFFH